MKVYFKTFGCRTNIYDTELLKSYVKNYEIVNDDNIADSERYKQNGICYHAYRNNINLAGTSVRSVFGKEKNPEDICCFYSICSMHINQFHGKFRKKKRYGEFP